MKEENIITHRLFNQQISETVFSNPEEIVHWMGAMQAQEFAQAKWSIGIRLQCTTAAEVEEAFNEGLILRTHILRPTWHFVAPADISWMLTVSAPRVHTANSHMYKKLELDEATLKQAIEIIIKALRREPQLLRTELHAKLTEANIQADGLRLAYILMYAELEGIICSGPRKGKQFTYMLLDERASGAKPLSREEGIVKLADRYFTSRGPAAIKDFAYWSGLTIKESTKGLLEIQSMFEKEVIDGEEYFFTDQTAKNKKSNQVAFLMPDYDEYGMSYKLKKVPMINNEKSINVWPYHIVIVDGKFGGKWKAEIKNKQVNGESVIHPSLAKTKEEEVKKAVDRYIAFHQ